MPHQQTQGVQIKGRDESAFVTLTRDGAKNLLDVGVGGFAGYVCADVDKTDATYYYYGFTDADGKWYVMRKTLGDPSAYRFASGVDNYSTAWTGRTAQSYDYYYGAF